MGQVGSGNERKGGEHAEPSLGAIQACKSTGASTWQAGYKLQHNGAHGTGGRGPLSTGHRPAGGAAFHAPTQPRRPQANPSGPHLAYTWTLSTALLPPPPDRVQAMACWQDWPPATEHSLLLPPT